MSSLLYGRLSQLRTLTDPAKPLIYAENSRGGVDRGMGAAESQPRPVGHEQPRPQPPPGGAGADPNDLDDAGTKKVPDAKVTISHAQDSLLALVPAEVLAIHAVAMSFGTTTEGSGSDAVVRINSAWEMSIAFWALATLAAGLVVVGGKSSGGKALNGSALLRGLIAALAFVLWTMLLPSSAFDALDWGLSTFARIMIAVIGAVILGVAANALAGQADKATPAPA